MGLVALDADPLGARMVTMIGTLVRFVAGVALVAVAGFVVFAGWVIGTDAGWREGAGTIAVLAPVGIFATVWGFRLTAGSVLEVVDRLSSES